MITKYNPLLAPGPEQWLALDESERLDIVYMYHFQNGMEGDESIQIHSSIHVAVETQIAMGDEYPVKATLNRLMNEGLDRHDAIHAIGSVLIKYLWDVGSGQNTSEDFTKDYFEEVKHFTYQKWLDEFEADMP